MKRTKIAILVGTLVVSVFIFVSCRKNAQPSWDTQILAPLVNASMSINDLITSNYIKSNPADSSVSLIYTDSLYNLSLLSIPDTTLKYDTISPLRTTVSPGSIMFASIPNPTNMTYSFGGVELVSGILQSGYMIYSITNPLSQPLDYYYCVHNIIKNNTDTLEIRIKINAGSTIKDSIYLGGYHIDFRGPKHNGYNIITTTIQVNLDPNASSFTINAGDKIVDANFMFRKVIPYYGKGYFGTDTNTYSASNLAFPVFSKIVSGSLALEKVNVNLTITNGVGVDASLELKQLSSYNSHTGKTVDLGAIGITNTTININRAVETHNPASPVIPTVTNFNLTPSNSNILDWLDNLPTNVGYSFHIETDPLGNVSGSNDFAYYGYGINSVISVVIPLSLIATNLTLADTLAVNFAGAGNTTQHVKSGKLTIYASNGFPFSAGLQMFLLNKNNVVVDSIFIPAQTIAAGNVDAISGKVTSPQNSVLTISLDAFHTQELFNTKTAILYARFNMGNSPSTYRKIYSYYQLGLKLVANFDYQVN